MLEMIVVSLLVLVSAAATLAILLALWHLMMMFRAIPRRWTTSVLGPFLLVSPRLHSKSGNFHRVRFFSSVITAFGLVAILVAMKWLVRT